MQVQHWCLGDNPRGVFQLQPPISPSLLRKYIVTHSLPGKDGNGGSLYFREGQVISMRDDLAKDPSFGSSTGPLSPAGILHLIIYQAPYTVSDAEG